MSKERKNLKILFMQIRDDQETKDEEFNEFVRFGRLNEGQITTLDVFATPEFPQDLPKDFDAVFVGGSSDANVLETEKYPFINSSKKLLKYCADNNIPTLASCFGFQTAAKALGGEVIKDKKNMETGSYTITLTDDAKNDVLYHDMPKQFPAISFHKLRVSKLPPSAILFASSELCPIHAFKLKDKPFYASQFHPELDRTDLIARIIRYQDRYFSDEESEAQLDRIKETCAETPEANSLIGKFVDRILLGKE